MLNAGSATESFVHVCLDKVCFCQTSVGGTNMSLVSVLFHIDHTSASVRVLFLIF